MSLAVVSADDFHAYTDRAIVNKTITGAAVTGAGVTGVAGSADASVGGEGDADTLAST